MKAAISVFTFILWIQTNALSQGTWNQKADLPGFSRIDAIGFSIGSFGYIGLGADSAYNFQNDFWQYDPGNDTWTQMANFIGSATTVEVEFAIGTKGFILANNSFYEWDQTGNSWVQKNNFPGNPRGSAVGFSIGAKGYIGTGLKSLNPPPPVFYDDFWEYDPATDSWTQKANFPIKRWDAVGFSIGAKGYIGTGYDGSRYNDFWEWDQGTNVWTQKAIFAGTSRAWAVGFSLGTKGYLGTGDIGGYTRDFWEWDQLSNTWVQKPDFGGVARGSAVGFAIGNKGYIGTGGSSPTAYYKDFWEWDPNGIGIAEEELSKVVAIAPNPCDGKFNISAEDLVITDIAVYSITGKQVYSAKMNGGAALVSLNDCAPGVYIVKAVISKEIVMKRVVIR